MSKGRQAGYLDFEKGFKKLSSSLVSDGKVKENLLVNILTYGALRYRDGISLTLDNFKNGKISLNEQKTGKFKQITLRKELKEALKLYKKKYPNQNQLFLNKRGTKLISIQYFNRFLKECVVKYDLKMHGNVSSHLFRKTFGRAFLNANGESIKVMIYLKEYLNHSDISVTYRYLGIELEEIEEMVLNV